MIVFSVALLKLSAKISANLRKDFFQIPYGWFRKHIATALRHKDQMYVQIMNDMPALTYSHIETHKTK